MDFPQPSEALRAHLRSRQPTVVLTGAGVSAESGLATFRGPDGMWEGRDPMQLATAEAFHDDPETVWRFYAWRRAQAAAAQPNAAHRALARWERAHGDLRVVTQNVDGLHERAGSADVLRLHGTLWRLRCEHERVESDDRNALGEEMPRCSSCKGILRPAVVWFGERLSDEVLAAAVEACRRARLVIVAGTSGLVHPAAGLPELARAEGAYVVEVNPERTPLSAAVHERIAASAGVAIPALAREAGVPVGAA